MVHNEAKRHHVFFYLGYLGNVTCWAREPCEVADTFVDPSKYPQLGDSWLGIEDGGLANWPMLSSA